MRYILPDGYIELKESGNTYCGRIAHDIMHKAELVQRESINGLSKMFNKNIEVDFNHCLLHMLRVSYIKIDGIAKAGE